MTLLMRTAGVTVLGLAVVSCGGGGGDEGAIKDVFRAFFRAFQDENVDALADLLSDECADADSRAAEAIERADPVSIPSVRASNSALPLAPKAASNAS